MIKQKNSVTKKISGDFFGFHRSGGGSSNFFNCFYSRSKSERHA
jgi:hypothetical protein